ncbi:hypothetical protein K0T92_13140 [Paenibacillus oenotherae]|uniref:Uncharacterized protein n=1 Tax=Paenibacillus oenotherae TaxID=1435645 RepID=A0ABS7D830_9BACL|nr:hypothetical protein [Paenibacillus oenotherae]MBW7475692.1 hypothetical protein [Paenibacillus oenotherae]
MSGTRWLYINKELKVIKIPSPKNHIYKPIKEWAGQEVLKILLFYKTKDRKPSKLLMIEFDRITLDSNGGYQLTDELVHEAMYNFLEFGFSTTEELAQRDSPPAIPRAPILPKPEEKKALYNYLQNQNKTLFMDAPYILESRINALNQIYKENLDLVKQSQKLRKKIEGNS